MPGAISAKVPLMMCVGGHQHLSGQTATTLAEAKKAGAVLAYGNFITVALNFLILAFIIFIMVKQINRLKRAAPEAPTEEVMLLRQIRDSLQSKAGKQLP